MTVGVVGMGLIGGSFAKAYKEAGKTVLGFDTDESILSFAELSGAVDGRLDTDTIKQCDLVLIAINPRVAMAYLESVASAIGADTVVIDCCGIKRMVCEIGFALAEKHGFIFVGGHPMAGSHKAGFKNSRADLYRGESMVLVPHVYDDAALFGRIEELLKPVGFAHLTVTTAEKHDEIIAFTSQMAHIVSNAYVKSPIAQAHIGLSAGSYKDLTRVARLNAEMWTELCIGNSDCLVEELDNLISSITSYKSALESKDAAKLRTLLEEGSDIKKRLDNE